MIQFLLFCSLSAGLFFSAGAQEIKSDSSFKPSGDLRMLSFGDFYYKAHADALNRGVNQYSNIEKGRNAFQIRRIYLGYSYQLHPKFAAELLLAAEDNVATNSGMISGDLLSNGKLAFFIKLANLRWKNLWKGTDLVIGQVSKPAFIFLVDPIWNYRSVERSLADQRYVPSYDLGAALQGKFDPSKGNFGYDFMISNGSGARPEADRFKLFSGDVYAKFLNKKLTVQLYADYQRFNWSTSFHQSGAMIKGFAGYSTSLFTAGVESFFYRGQNEVVGIKVNSADTISANAFAVSFFVRGAFIKDRLNYFVRMDRFNPYINYNEQAYTSYKGFNPNYEPNNKETFFTAGIDFTPVPNVHFIPNVWYNGFKSQRRFVSPSEFRDYDLVYRITFSYAYGR